MPARENRKTEAHQMSVTFRNLHDRRLGVALLGYFLAYLFLAVVSRSGAEIPILSSYNAVLSETFWAVLDAQPSVIPCDSWKCIVYFVLPTITIGGVWYILSLLTVASIESYKDRF
jgi:hypothetical protein